MREKRHSGLNMIYSGTAINNIFSAQIFFPFSLDSGAKEKGLAGGQCLTWLGLLVQTCPAA